MKYEWKDLPNYIRLTNDVWEIFSYSRVLVPICETKEEREALEE